MLECRLSQGAALKKILDAIRELIVDTNFDASEAGISLQSMDSSHVSLVNLHLREDGFDFFRCDRNLSLGINLANMAKILKCCGNEDSVTLRANEEEDSCTFLFENQESSRISEFTMKLMDIDSEHLGIPETEYKATVRMSSSEFQRIIRDLSTMGDTCTIDATKEGIKFSTSGEGGSGNVTIKQSAVADKPDEGTFIDLQEPVKMNFALRYLSFFTKATPLSSTVNIAMSPDVPLLIEYKIENIGHIRYYLAPKIDEEEDD